MLKKRSGKNLIHFFYHLLVVLVMAMPLLSGLVRIIYVQSNKNAFESYYGDTINQHQIESDSLGSLQQGLHYHFVNAYTPNPSSVDTTFIITITDFVPISDLISSLADVGIDQLRFVCRLNSYCSIEFYKNGTEQLGYSLSGRVIEFEFTYIDISNVNTYLDDYLTFTYDYYVDYSYLDNVFDYSIWKTMKDFTFHSDFRFTDIANGMLMTFDNNNLYIEYINFYINWVLTCAVISFAPYVLLSFYHLAIHLLDKFMNKGENL